MPTFSKRSLDNLTQAHPDLQRVMKAAILYTDFTVICGYRGRADQDKALAEKRSKARFGQSPHNFTPALAVDIVPYPLNWNDLKAFDEMGAVVMREALKLNVALTWGKFFSFKDYPHFELKDWQKLK